MEQEIKICFIGDSLVNGACDKTMLGWTGRVCADASEKGFNLTYYNLGIRGNTSTDILSRWRQECDSRVFNSNDSRIVLSCGINDTVIVDGTLRVTTQLSCNNISTLLNDATQYKLLVVSPTPVNDEAHNARIASLSNEFSKIADSFNVPYIDVFTALKNDAGYLQSILRNHDCYPQGYHPTDAGYEIIAEKIINSSEWWFNVA